jgi:hypothetical protein
MSDIAACSDELCPTRLSCFRFMQERGSWQPYIDTGRSLNHLTCEYFIPTREGDRLRNLNAKPAQEKP